MNGFAWHGRALYWGPFQVGEVRTWGAGLWRAYVGGATVLAHPSRNGWRQDEAAAKAAAEQAAGSVIAVLLAAERGRA